LIDAMGRWGSDRGQHSGLPDWVPAHTMAGSVNSSGSMIICRSAIQIAKRCCRNDQASGEEQVIDAMTVTITRQNYQSHECVSAQENSRK